MTEVAILRVLDQAGESAESWPVFCAAGTSYSYHDMRLTVVVDDASSNWALVFEVLEEEHDGGILNTPYLVSPQGSLRLDLDVTPVEIFRDEEGSTPVVTVVCGSFGEVEVGAEQRAVLLARQGADSAGSERSIWIQAYLEEVPHFWKRSGRQVIELACSSLNDLTFRSPRVLLTSDAFAHVIGAALGEPAAKQPWDMKPSESAAYRSLARAIQAKDASLFLPGASTLAWELHVRRAPNFGS